MQTLQPTDTLYSYNTFPSIEPHDLVVKHIHGRGIIINRPSWLYFVRISVIGIVIGFFHFRNGINDIDKDIFTILVTQKRLRNIRFNYPIFFNKAINIIDTRVNGHITVGYVPVY